jgi:WD40 repeat protein
MVLRGHGAGPPELWGEGVWDVNFSPDGKHLVTAGADGDLKVWDLVNGSEILSIPAGIGILLHAQFNPDGDIIIMRAHDGITKVLDSTTGQELLVFAGAQFGTIDDISVSIDGNFLVTSSSDKLEVWDLKASLSTGTTVKVTILAVRGEFISPIFSPDGTQVTVVSGGEIHFYVFDIDQLIALAHSRVTRALTEEECHQYLHLEACP